MAVSPEGSLQMQAELERIGLPSTTAEKFSRMFCKPQVPEEWLTLIQSTKNDNTISSGKKIGSLLLAYNQLQQHFSEATNVTVDVFDPNQKGGEFLMEGVDEEKGKYAVDDVNGLWDVDDLEELDEYKMRNNRGTFFIFVMKEGRPGADHDVRRYKEIAKKLGFNEILIHEDMNAAEIKDLLTKYGKEDHSNDDCVVCAVAAHGTKEDKIKVKGELIDLNEFVKHFNEHNCKDLKGKPKIIIVQSCRGHTLERPVPKGTNNDEHAVAEQTKEQTKEKDVYGELKDYAENLATNYNDLLLASSSIPDTVSRRVEEDGSLYIKHLLEEIKDKDRRDICEILTKVNCRVSSMEFTNDDGRKFIQMPCFRSNLTKKLHFHTQNEM